MPGATHELTDGSAALDFGATRREAVVRAAADRCRNRETGVGRHGEPVADHADQSDNHPDHLNRHTPAHSPPPSAGGA
jgi:hypothetical protein